MKTGYKLYTEIASPTVGICLGRKFYTSSGMYGVPAWTFESCSSAFGGPDEYNTFEEAEDAKYRVAKYFDISLMDIKILKCNHLTD